MARDDLLVPVLVQGVAQGFCAKWAEGMSFWIPRDTVHRSGLARLVDSSGKLTLQGEAPGISSEAVDFLRQLRAYTENPPVSSRLPFSYRAIPSSLRTLVASLMGRLNRYALDQGHTFPIWPLDLSADFLADLIDGQRSAFASGPTPVVLTHDLDSEEGLENLVSMFLDLEEEMGARSTSYVVPFAWKLDCSLLDEVKRRGHGLGIHGYDHSNRTPFLRTEERVGRLQAARDIVDRYQITGYRSPSLLRTRELLRDLAMFYRYDSSIPTSGGLFPVPNNGCASARPFRIGSIIEIPITLPRDGSLLFLGYRPDEILEMWISCAELIARSGGVVTLLTHCEAHFSGSQAMLNVYRRFLEYVSTSNKYEWSTPNHVLRKFLQHEYIREQDG